MGDKEIPVGGIAGKAVADMVENSAMIHSVKGKAGHFPGILPQTLFKAA